MADNQTDDTGNGILTPSERYINPYTDFGFKKLFGTEMNKDLLISFLNALPSMGSRQIADVEYMNSEHLGDGYGDRRAVFDVYCKTADGGRFIVEMQKAEQEFFKDRSVFYSTFAIREQAPKGQKWDYHLEDVYTVGVLNFKFPDDEYPADKFFHEVKLKDIEDNHGGPATTLSMSQPPFYEKLTFLYLEMPKFNKREDELVTMFDKWMFVLRNLARLLERPKALQDRVFKKLFEQAEIAQYTPEERREYEASVKNYWDYFSTVKTALKKGRAEGRIEGKAEGKAEDARKMKALGLSEDIIMQVTGLTAEEIAAL